MTLNDKLLTFLAGNDWAFVLHDFTLIMMKIYTNFCCCLREWLKFYSWEITFDKILCKTIDKGKDGVTTSLTFKMADDRCQLSTSDELSLNL